MQTTEINTIASVPVATPDNYVKITAIATDVNSYFNCVNEKNDTTTNVATSVSTLQATIDNLEQTIAERKRDVGVAMDRAALTRSPELSRSYYDGWFPISRPFKHYTIPVLIGLSLFLGTMSFFYLMSLLGIHTHFVFSLPQASVYSSGTGFRSGGIFGNRPFWIMTVIAIILLALTIYGFTK